jgi:hypothetical protein
MLYASPLPVPATLRQGSAELAIEFALRDTPGDLGINLVITIAPVQ